MARRDTLEEIKKVLGVIPGFVDQMEDLTLDHWWSISRGFLMIDTALPVKTKALIGLGAAAVVGCGYCVQIFTELAQLAKATTQEIREATEVAGGVGCDSSYMAGIKSEVPGFRETAGPITAHSQNGKQHNNGK